MRLPEVDGYDVCLRLKTDSRTEGIPVIFLTELDREEDEAKGLAHGAIDYMFKPIRPPILTARVRNHLELKRYRDFLENLSSTDSLTGIPNRRMFDDALPGQTERPQPDQERPG